MILIEDFSQVFFSNQKYFLKKELNVVKFNNVRKYFGIPELSFISTLNPLRIKKRIMIYKEIILWDYYLLFLMKKFLYIFKINQPFGFKKIYNILERKIRAFPYCLHINLFSIYLFRHINFNVVKNKRIRNYNWLKKRIVNHKIKFVDFINFNTDEVPFFAIIHFEKAQKIKKMLIKHNIYPPNLWPIPENRIAPEIKFIRSKYIFLPIDHRYDERDMNFILKILNNWKGIEG